MEQFIRSDEYYLQDASVIVLFYLHFRLLIYWTESQVIYIRKKD
ncbi:uncharacterized protein METZ01_LOCUS97062 [marine metagenome]|uniref:Uncharacterized protein n=1 Tax=marine metagenome TaxID=408172 RepID=A0A381VWR0_9ZZZZ